MGIMRSKRLDANSLAGQRAGRQNENKNAMKEYRAIWLRIMDLPGQFVFMKPSRM